MPAGMNAHFRFLRLVYAEDDDVGGANPSGTVLHDWIEGRIDEEPSNTAFLQQGLQTVKIFSSTFRGHQLTFREQDEVQLISPPNHPYFGKTFRVIERLDSSNHPAQKRNMVSAKLTRSQVSHAEEYQ